MRALLSQPRCRVATVEDRRAVERYIQNGRLSLTDACVAQASWHHDKAALIAFDEDIMKESKTR